MNLEEIKKLIARLLPKHLDFVASYEKAKNYYINKPDIVFKNKKEDNGGLRNADNRVPLNFHGLLVNQKAAYIFTVPPEFDIGSDEGNKKLKALLGAKFGKACKDLCVEASNASVAWLHIWKDKEEIKYTSLNPSSIIPIWDKGIDRKLLGVIRTYIDIKENGKSYTRYEYWDDSYCYFYEVEGDKSVESNLSELKIDELGKNSFKHGFEDVPFIAFYNNSIKKSDLDSIKDLIDTYCNVYNGFVNDLEDIQELVIVLANYGGQDKEEFLRDLKSYKMVQLDEGGQISTLNIQIPIEARKELLANTRKLIFEQGMGIDPDPTNFGNSSGVALQFLYSLLELKAGLMETEFRVSFAKFIKVLCKATRINIKDEITQVWTRTSVRNASELVDMCKNSKGIISDETLLAHHPFVSDVAKEQQKLKEQRQMDVDALDKIYKGDEA